MRDRRAGRLSLRFSDVCNRDLKPTTWEQLRDVCRGWKHAVQRGVMEVEKKGKQQWKSEDVAGSRGSNRKRSFHIPTSPVIPTEDTVMQRSGS